MRAPSLIVVGLALSACWADFPDSRFNVDGAVADWPQQPDWGQQPDGPRPDRAPGDSKPADRPPPDKPPGPDAFKCVANSFVECKVGKLVKCTSTGVGTVEVSCSPANCDSTLKRCDECDPATTQPVCNTGSTAVISCSSDGLKVTTTCTKGCKNGKCCLDVDGDTVTDCAGDCDDNNPLVKPGQTNYYSTPRSSGSYDYDCDSTEEKQYTTNVNCQVSGADCSGAGWATGETAPACGATGTFVECKRTGASCQLGKSTANFPQPCQ